MPYKIKKQCGNKACPAIIDPGRTYCPECLTQSRKRYDRHDRDRHNVYATKQWRSVRKMKLARDVFCECSECVGTLVVAEVVHHKREISDRPDLTFTMDNLMSMAKACHDRLHGFKAR